MFNVVKVAVEMYPIRQTNKSGTSLKVFFFFFYMSTTKSTCVNLPPYTHGVHGHTHKVQG